MNAEPATPLAANQRVEVLDVLRGVALLGVLVVNLTEFASANVMATEQQLLSLPTAPFDLALYDVIQWLFRDKANTLFAFLFGLGFFLQMERLEARDADFDKIYARRLLVLLAIGLVHLFFVWPGDILHLYALAGFALLAMRNVSNRDLLAFGLICALAGRTAQKIFTEFSPFPATSQASGYDEASVLLRQQLAASGDYAAMVQNFAQWTWADYFASGMIIGWLLYALGRFLIGAWVGRHGWITRAADFLPQWRRLARWLLPLGLSLEGGATLLAASPLLPEWEHRQFFADMLHLFAVPVLTAGYVAALVAWFHSPRGARWLRPFAWTGRMALTNYLMQSFIIAFLLSGVGPGLALAGRIGASALLGIAIAAYSVQILFSRWWLAHFAFGPAEWLWRALTYGNFPAMRLALPRLRP